MREQVILRDRHCVFPWCGRDARATDLDHTIAYVPMDEGGPPGQTHPHNLAPLCRRHHRAKTFTSWHYERARDGTHHVDQPPRTHLRGRTPRHPPHEHAPTRPARRRTPSPPDTEARPGASMPVIRSSRTANRTLLPMRVRLPAVRGTVSRVSAVEQVLEAARARASALGDGDAQRLLDLLHRDFRWTTHVGETHDPAEYIRRNTAGDTVDGERPCATSNTSTGSQ